MPDATVEFFESLRRRGNDPLLRRASGTVRFEIGDGQPSTWSLKVDHGNLAVSHAARKADCTIRAEKDVFDRIAGGELNAMTAVLRGDVAVDGDPELLLMFQRLLPGGQPDSNERKDR